LLVSHRLRSASWLRRSESEILPTMGSTVQFDLLAQAHVVHQAVYDFVGFAMHFSEILPSRRAVRPDSTFGFFGDDFHFMRDAGLTSVSVGASATSSPLLVSMYTSRMPLLAIFSISLSS